MLMIESSSHMKHHLQCAVQQEPHQILHLPRKIAFQNLRKMYLIRAWSDHEVRRGLLSRFGDAFCIEIPAIYPNFTRCCALPRQVTLRHHQMLHIATGSDTCKITTCLRLPRKVTSGKITKYCACHEKWLSWLSLLGQMRCEWCGTLLNCYLTELLLDWPVTLLNCYLTELLLDWTATDWTATWLKLFLDWTGARLSCYRTELLFYWTVTWLSCYLTETVTLLRCLLYWAVALLSVTLLSCYFTEPLLFWAVILLNC